MADVDPRFTMANERTFLAYNRTALALIGGGLAAGQLIDFRTSWARLLVALGPIGLGVIVAVAGLARWRDNETALARGDSLPAATLPRSLTVGLVLVAIAEAVVLAVDTLG